MASPDLSRKMMRAAQVLAVGGSPGEAAAAAAIAPRTLRTWRTRADFCSILDGLLDEASATTKRRLRTLGERAARTLGEIMADPEAPASPRVSAAGRVLDSIFRLDEMEKLDAIERRLTEIEARLGERGRP